MKAKTRLDIALVQRGLVDSRNRAQSLVMARRVLVNGRHVDKVGSQVTDEDEIVVTDLEHPWVGRGGMKLARAIDAFAVDVAGRICVDIGASTGGFTDVLLKSSAAKVYAVDVGYGQLDASLRNDSRVELRERVNARYLQAEDFSEPVTLVVVDVSFISLRLILPAIVKFLKCGGQLIALIKPQFEVGRERVGKGGIIRDEADRAAAVEGVTSAARALGFELDDVIESPIRGAEGNVEYLMHGRLLRENEKKRDGGADED
jgi:23S rRNA (cytidine1920-2'-O)/16S rRNA (cytidine1409-2'-O)-methyltransferase